MMMIMMAFCKSSPNTNVSLQRPTRLTRILKCGHLDCTLYRTCSFSAHKWTSQPHQAIHGSFFTIQHWTERPSYGSTLILMPESRHCPTRTRIMTCGPCFNVSLRFPKSLHTRHLTDCSQRRQRPPSAWTTRSSFLPFLKESEWETSWIRPTEGIAIDMIEHKYSSNFKSVFLLPKSTE